MWSLVLAVLVPVVLAGSECPVAGDYANATVNAWVRALSFGPLPSKTQPDVSLYVTEGSVGIGENSVITFTGRSFRWVYRNPLGLSSTLATGYDGRLIFGDAASDMPLDLLPGSYLMCNAPPDTFRAPDTLWQVRRFGQGSCKEFSKRLINSVGRVADS